jgi:hypothetical protein
LGAACHIAAGEGREDQEEKNPNTGNQEKEGPKLGNPSILKSPQGQTTTHPKKRDPAGPSDPVLCEVSRLGNRSETKCETVENGDDRLGSVVSLPKEDDLSEEDESLEV